MNNIKFSYIEAFEQSVRIYAIHFRTLILFSALTIFVPYLCASFATILVPLALGLSVFLFIMLIDVYAKCEAGVELAFNNVISDSWRRVWPALGGFVLFNVVLFICLFLLVIPAVIWWTLFSLHLFVQVIEGKSIFEAFTRCKELVTGEFARVLQAHAAVFVLICAAFLPFTFGMQLLFVPLLVQDIVITVISALLLPLITGFYYQLFIYLRHKKDGQLKIHERMVTGNTP